MKRRALIAATTVLATASAARAQGGRRIPIVGILTPSTADAPNTVYLALHGGLRDLGYVEGQTIRIEGRPANGRPELLPGMAAELVRLGVDVMVAIALPSIRAAQQATQTIPIVATELQVDPVQAGLAQSLRRPGGNITGLFQNLPSLTGKWLELLREVAPKARRVGLLWDVGTGNWQLTAAQAVANSLSVELQILEFRDPRDIPAALAAGAKGGIEALAMLSSPFVRTSSKTIADFALQNRLPAIAPFQEFPLAGGLMAYGPDLDVYWPLVAIFVDKVLKGARPGDLPIEQPTKFRFSVNLATAKAIGIELPPSLLIRADEMIE